LTLLTDMLPQGNIVPEDIYEVKQTIFPLDLEVEKSMRARMIATEKALVICGLNR
jgi:hypothetical protein